MEQVLNILCDECRQVFNVYERAYKETNGDIEEIGFACPRCGHRYIAGRTNQAIRALQKEVQKAQKAWQDALRDRSATPRKIRRLRRRLDTARADLARAWERFSAQEARV